MAEEIGRTGHLKKLMLLNPFNLHIPDSLNDAAKLYSQLDNCRLQAGGTFLVNNLKMLKRKGSKTPENIICLKKISELRGIQFKKNQLTIKAMTTFSDLLESQEVSQHLGILGNICHNIATQPIRNMATIGGNLTCRYTWTELPAIMTGLGATLHFYGPDSKEEAVTAEAFFNAAAKSDKILSYIVIPVVPETRYSYQRIQKSVPVDIPLCALFITAKVLKNSLTNVKVSVNNTIHFAQRDSQLEKFLENKPLSDTLAHESLSHIDSDLYDTRSTDYKKYIFRESIKNAITEIVKGTS